MWYFKKANDSFGPFDDRQLKQMLAAGVLLQSTLVSQNPDRDEWLQLSQTSIATPEELQPSNQVAATLPLDQKKDHGISLQLSETIRLDLCYIPPGTAILGSPEGEYWRYSPTPKRSLFGTSAKAKAIEANFHMMIEDQRAVTIPSGFFLAKYATTLSQWNALLTPHTPPLPEIAANLPITGINASEAEQFASAINERFPKYHARLPTADEWEYAARAGTTKPWISGDSPRSLRDFAWDCTTSDDACSVDLLKFLVIGEIGAPQHRLHPVGLKKPSPWGLYDVHGNVWEWCSDKYQYNGQDLKYRHYCIRGRLEQDIHAALIKGQYVRIVKGGSYRYDDAASRLARKEIRAQDMRAPDISFRLLLTQK